MKATAGCARRNVIVFPVFSYIFSNTLFFTLEIYFRTYKITNTHIEICPMS